MSDRNWARFEDAASAATFASGLGVPYCTYECDGLHIVDWRHVHLYDNSGKLMCEGTSDEVNDWIEVNWAKRGPSEVHPFSVFEPMGFKLDGTDHTYYYFDNGEFTGCG